MVKRTRKIPKPDEVPVTDVQRRIIFEMRLKGKALYTRTTGTGIDFGSVAIAAPDPTIMSLQFKGLIVWSGGKSSFVLSRLGERVADTVSPKPVHPSEEE